LIVHSVTGTSRADKDATVVAIEAYRRPGSTVNVRARVFEIPAGAAPGTALGTELTAELQSSIGAVVFVDDLRPNVAYELGFFHGRGRRVLLVTRQPVDSVWRSISDLAGAALVHLDSVALPLAIDSYLNRLYEELSRVPDWRGIALPVPASNILAHREQLTGTYDYDPHGPFGPKIRIASWAPVEIDLHWNLLPGATFAVVFRGISPGAEFTLYFEVRFRDRAGDRNRVWLGLTSTRGRLLLQREERTFPTQRPTADWALVAGELSDLLNRGWILGAGPVDFIERVRFRAGYPDESNAVPIEVGYLRVTGRWE
jgi:hypothetical protein